MLRQYSIFLARFSDGTYQHFAARNFDSALFDISYFLTELKDDDVKLISIEVDTEVSPVLMFKK